MAGGASALKRLSDLRNRASFGTKAAATRVAMMEKRARLSSLAKVVSWAGTAAKLLNVVSAGYDVYNCWHP